MRKNFKDKCDGCGEYKVLKGFNGSCLCQKCTKNIEVTKSEKKIIKCDDKKAVAKQLSIFEMLEVL